MNLSNNYQKPSCTSIWTGPYHQVFTITRPLYQLRVDTFTFRKISEFIEREAKRSGIILPVPTATLSQWIMEQKCEAAQKNVDNVQKKGGNWSVFDFCNQFLQSKIAIKEAVQDLLDRLYTQHNVVYAEIRFAPIFSTLKGLSAREAVEAALAGLSIKSFCKWLIFLGHFQARFRCSGQSSRRDNYLLNEIHGRISRA